jgi:ABC-type xylose transport system permease subunit
MSITHPFVSAPQAQRRPTAPPAGQVIRRLMQGDLASLRVVLELAVIWAIFEVANNSFLTEVNLTNLALQISGVALILIGVVLVLLLGEIDLSVGSVTASPRE